MGEPWGSVDLFKGANSRIGFYLNLNDLHDPIGVAQGRWGGAASMLHLFTKLHGFPGSHFTNCGRHRLSDAESGSRSGGLQPPLLEGYRSAHYIYEIASKSFESCCTLPKRLLKYWTAL